MVLQNLKRSRIATFLFPHYAYLANGKLLTLFRIAYLVGKIKVKLLFYGPLVILRSILYGMFAQNGFGAA